jgi:hypothetical protein
VLPFELVRAFSFLNVPEQPAPESPVRPFM